MQNDPYTFYSFSLIICLRIFCLAFGPVHIVMGSITLSFSYMNFLARIKVALKRHGSSGILICFLLFWALADCLNRDPMAYYFPQLRWVTESPNVGAQIANEKFRAVWFKIQMNVNQVLLCSMFLSSTVFL